MSNFKCYNCGAELSKVGRYDYYNYVCSLEFCIPNNSYYNSFLKIKDNAIIEYAFTFLYNKKYYRIDCTNYHIVATYIMASNADNKVDSNGYFFQGSELKINKYYPITENYINELPRIIDNLMKLMVFI
jgi:hypothetical protein